MGIKALIVRPFARRISQRIDRWSKTAIQCQEDIFNRLILSAKDTRFGKEHRFSGIRTYADFKANVPIRDYEGLKPYIQSILEGQRDVLWKGKPQYFAKTSGTTSGVKFIPLTKESIPNHFGTARNAMFHFAAQTDSFDFFEGKMIFLSGSPELSEQSGIKTGRLSGIVNHMVPSWLKGSQLPSYKTNCIEDWEPKLDAIVQETLGQDMRLISGIPPWVQMYYERLLEVSKKDTICDLFPNFSTFVYGGVNFEPYRDSLEQLVGKRLDSIETYPASEGFIAFQDSPTFDGLLLNVHSGIFFEFIPLEEIHKDHPTRLSLKEVELGVNYVLILNTNAGLWGYNIGDTVQFVSLNPYKIIVSGRVKHFISAFGEHVIGKEVEQAIQQALHPTSAKVTEFSVAPQVTPSNGGLPYHEWLIEFALPPVDMEKFRHDLDQAMCQQNIYYRDLIDGKVLKPLVVRSLRKDTFRDYMKTQGKLGGQNKVPRLANDRKIAKALEGLQT